MKNRSLLLAILLLAACTPFDIHHMTVEYTAEPLGVDVVAPRFGWQMKSSRQGAAQQSYRIQVSDEKGSLVWDSGTVAESQSQGILYEGEALTPRTSFDWTVTVTDEKGKKQTASSHFETSLLSTSDTDPAWNGARWIGGDASALPFEPQYLSVFRLRFCL